MHTYSLQVMPFTTHAPSPIRVAIAGATGYAGQELLRLLARHPGVRLTAAMSSGGDTRRLPALARIWDGEVRPLDAAALVRECEAVFLGLPEAASADIGASLAGSGVRVIDLSGAFRLRDRTLRTRWYPGTAALPDGTLYALPERSRTKLPGARLASCPGCYPTAALLALQPLADAALIDGDVIIDAKSGVSGAGKAATDRTHFSENHASAAAYGVFSHRHGAEMEQALGRAVTFVPHLVPLNRGILETIYAHLAPRTSAAAVGDAMHAAYADAPFVRLWDDELPEIKHSAYTPFCDIGWRVDEATNRLVIVACLDNLLKGAASQAVQNFNLMHGLDERMGLL
ncbi:MAG: N-acetyl-gamma-glutamyl-phosphate reductase [Vicinamibacterales bacterium]